MSRAPVTVLLALTLFGCDAAKEPFSRAAQAEAAGKLDEARAAYAEVCSKKADSPRCAIAKKRTEELAIKSAYQAIDVGAYATAKDALAPIKATPADPAIGRAAGAALEDAELVAGAAEVEALAGSKAEIMGKMVKIADGHTAAAPRARAWIEKNGPAMLLEEAKAACKPGGTGSCVETYRALVARYPGSPEATEAAKLEGDEYERIRKVCREAENLVIQRLEIYNKKEKHAACVEEQGAMADGTCKEELAIPTETDDPFSTSFLDRAFEKKLGEIEDPGYVKLFREKYARVADKGEHDADTWNKRGGEKK
jgi:hypothetical protein